MIDFRLIVTAEANPSLKIVDNKLKCHIYCSSFPAGWNLRSVECVLAIWPQKAVWHLGEEVRMGNPLRKHACSHNQTSFNSPLRPWLALSIHKRFQFKQFKYLVIPFIPLQCFISPMQEISAFNYWIMESFKIKELVVLLPWGCKPFYSPRQAKLARKNLGGCKRLLLLVFLCETNYSKTIMMGLVGLYALILSKSLTN
jgi:hypothetical protein